VSLTNLTRRLNALGKVPERATREAARAAERIARAHGDAIGPVHMGRKKRTVRLRAVSRFRGSGNHVQARIWGRPTGPWVWVTAGTRPHVIPKARRGKARTTRYLKAAGYEHPIGRPILHSGATGRGAWWKVRRDVMREAPRVYARAVAKAVRS
jgi:predicted TIM-barrel fold metal-dependent hydrolase